MSVTVPITVSGVYDPVTGKTSYADADGNQTEITDAHYKDYTYSVSNGAATITKYTGSARNLYVPSTLGGYPVKRINDQVFRGCKFETAVLPNQLEYIGAYAFENCVHLTSVTLPESLTTICAGAFNGCTKLKSLTIPQYVTQMYSRWNYNDVSCLDGSSIETVVFEGGRDRIPYRACANVSSLKTVVIPASVQEFGNYVFDNSTAVSIHGYANTTAQTYAENHSISFVTLDCAHTNTQTKYAYPSNACNDGYTGDVYCVDCGFLLQQGVTIPATGHTYVKVSETPATCTKAGVIKYMCSGCKQSYDVLIPATAHDFQSEVVAATCSQSGYTQYTCTVCGYSYRTDYTQPGAHSFVKTTVAATCTAAGYDCYTCSVCGSAYTTGFTAPLGHDLQVIQIDDQSESNGHIFEYLRCARCMDTATDTIRTTHVTDASGHYVWKAGCYQDQVVQAGDCTHKKIVVRVCTVEDPTGTGTCTAQLRTESEAPGHRVEQWTVTLDPTCATDGQRTGTCTVCREEVHQVIAAAPEYGHILQYSGSEPGVCIYTCTRCGVTERRRADVVEAQFFDHMGAADKSALGYVYDLNKDGTINLRDYVLLQRIAAAGT